ncbi:MAG: hypothetical protein Q8K30_07200 [Candidatus Gracilibacteria bacterium]|nr:hypothetical protein [Candidatus Gracilibacteria bacterium]MDP2395701.1 hypothetical protein [bacterium]MDP3381141.1 hypothetical protein [bacterium]
MTSLYFFIKNFDYYLEYFTQKIEDILENKKYRYLFNVIMLSGPIFLLSTVYTVFTCSEIELVGYQKESGTWVRESIIELFIFFETLTMRKSGRVVQITVLGYAITLFMIYIGTIIR